MAGLTNLTVDSKLTFPNGETMPIFGFGTFQRNPNEDSTPLVYGALECGYRHLDTALFYQNEKEVGRAVNKWIKDGKGKREDVFVTTKLPPYGNRPSDVAKCMQISLDNLGLDYIDLYLFHNPIGWERPEGGLEAPMDLKRVKMDKTTDLVAIWKELEAEVDAGRAKSIGISNFNEEQVERIVKAARIIPACNQVEAHVHLQQKPLRSILKKHGIAMVAYGALGSPGRSAVHTNTRIPPLLDDPTVLKISQKHNKSPSHVLVRFLLQEGISVIPKSKNPQRIKDNINLFDFSLDLEDMTSLRALDRGEEGRSFLFDVLPGYASHPEYPFKSHVN